MNRIKDLINVLGKKETLARSSTEKADRICKICGKPAICFTRPRGELEYNLSFICQSCQDYYLLD